MEKELFRISINLETENREFIESDIKFLHLAQQLSYRKKISRYIRRHICLT